MSDMNFWLGILAGAIGLWFVLRYMQGYGLIASYFNAKNLLRLLGMYSIFEHTKTKNTDKGPYLTGNNKTELLLYGLVYLAVAAFSISR